MSATPVPALLFELVERARRILEVYEKHASPNDFAQDELSTDAVLWNFVVIGEVCNRLGKEFHDTHPEIPWAKVIGLRNIVAHGYDVVDWRVVCPIIENDLEALLGNARRLLDAYGPPPAS